MDKESLEHGLGVGNIANAPHHFSGITPLPNRTRISTLVREVLRSRDGITRAEAIATEAIG